MSNNEILREFLMETHENLALLDSDLVRLEANPDEKATLAQVFRTLHSVKGTAGFMGLLKLQAITHSAESLLGRLRAGELRFNRPIATALLLVVDAIREILANLESSDGEGSGDYTALSAEVDRLRETGGMVPSDSLPEVRTQVFESGLEMPLPPSLTVFHTPPVPSGTHVPTSDATIAPRDVDSPPSEATDGRQASVVDAAIRVDVGLLDKLMTLVGELVLARNQIMQFSSSKEDPAFLGTVQRLNLLTTELQAGVMKTRMQPINAIWSKFPRVVRDLAVECQKQARLEMEGQDTELDKSIIESIRDPLTHMVRNAVDHGIELPGKRQASGKPLEGLIRLHAFHEGGKVVIEIADDGGGIDTERVRAKAIQAKLITAEQADSLNDSELVNLVFLPGFSTADKVTQFSGRGVGMDVVRTNIEKIGGAVTIENRLGQGTTIRMKIPLTLAIIPALTISSAGDRYCIPQVSLMELVRLEGEQAERGIEMIHGAPVYRLRGNLLPLVYLNQQLENQGSRVSQFSGTVTAEPGPLTSGVINIVVLQADDHPFGLIVDEIHDTEEIVVKPLQKQIKGISIFAGVTIMGDGRVALILDVLGLAQRANVVCRVRERALSKKPVDPIASNVDCQTVLLFGTLDGGRMAVPLSHVDRLEEFPRSAIERVGLQEIVQYHDEILPLVDLSQVMLPKNRTKRTTAGWSLAPSPPGSLQVIVFAYKGRRVGIVVDRILDIAEETLISRSTAYRPGVLFTAVIQDRVTEFLDVEHVIHYVDSDLLGPAALSLAEA